jgi:hyperosmotically inducible periplasmic protein
MKKSLPMIVTAMVCVNVVFWSLTGRAQPEPQDPQQEGVATKAAEKLDDFGRAIKRGFLNAEESVRDGLNKTGETVRESFAKTRDTVQSMGIPSRVYGRLHWDKEFQNIPLFVKAEGGTVTVRGTLPDDVSKAKAIDLIKDTVGVTRVIDQLNVISSSTSVSPAAAKRSVKTSTVENRDPE